MQELDDIVHKEAIDRGCYPSPLNYRGFPKSCCTSLNEVICHGIPDSTAAKEGDILKLDVTLYKDGVHADLCETYCVGNVDQKGILLGQTTYDCLQQAIKACKVGMMYRDIGAVIEAHAKKNGLSVVRSYCGHGIGEIFHTAPNVPHYAKNKAQGVMRVGHV